MNKFKLFKQFIVIKNINFLLPYGKKKMKFFEQLKTKERLIYVK